MKIKELKKILEDYDKEQEIFVFDYSTGENIEVDGVSLFDESSKHEKGNPLGININDKV